MSVFSDQLKKKIEGFVGRYETRRSAILHRFTEVVAHGIAGQMNTPTPKRIDYADGCVARIEARTTLTRRLLRIIDACTIRSPSCVSEVHGRLSCQLVGRVVYGARRRCSA